MSEVQNDITNQHVYNVDDKGHWIRDMRHGTGYVVWRESTGCYTVLVTWPLDQLIYLTPHEMILYEIP